MSISIIIRSRNSPTLMQCLGQIMRVASEEDEIVIVDSSDKKPTIPADERISLIHSDLQRFEAYLAGAKVSKQEALLFLDSDQILSKGLLEELSAVNSDASVIAERSFNKNLIGKMMDKRRKYFEDLYRRSPTPFLPVIPRFYKKEIVLKAFAHISGTTLREVVQHEDSILFYEIWKSCKNVSFVEQMIYNLDPGFFDFIKKSYNYGRNNQSALSSKWLGEEHKQLIRRLDMHRVYFDRELGINQGFVIDLMKGISYLLGKSSALVGLGMSNS